MWIQCLLILEGWWEEMSFLQRDQTDRSRYTRVFCYSGEYYCLSNRWRREFCSWIIWFWLCISWTRLLRILSILATGGICATSSPWSVKGEGVVGRSFFRVVWQTLMLGHSCSLAIFEVSRVGVFFDHGGWRKPNSPHYLDRPRRFAKLEQHFVYVDNGGNGSICKHSDAQISVKTKSKR